MTWDFGKTIQMLSVIVDYAIMKETRLPIHSNTIDSRQEDKMEQDTIAMKGTLDKEPILSLNNTRASLVVSPSSLTLNWQNEAKKFAQGLKTLVIRGTLAERKKQIEIAKRLLKLGIDIEDIEKATELTKEEIENLK